MEQLKKVPTACAVCGSCCEVEACVEDGRLVSIEGAKCAKGVAGAQFEYNPERILYPMKRTGEKGEGKFIRISWEEAYQIIAEELLKIREKYGARSLVTYVGYPKWIRPAYLRFANAFGTPNFCTEIQHLLSGGGLWPGDLCMEMGSAVRTLLIPIHCWCGVPICITAIPAWEKCTSG